MKMPRFTLYRLLAAVMVSAAPLLATAQSSDFPNKPITIVVPFPPGGVTDQLARGIGQKMAENMKVTVLVENKPGGGAQIAANSVKQAPADGYTLFIGDIGAFALNPLLYAKLSYDMSKDFTVLARLVQAPALLVVPANSPYNTMAELVNAAKTRPNGLNIASQSAGSGGHLFAEMLRAQTSGKFNHVPYRGSAPALTDLIGGQVDVFFDPILTSGPFVKDGKLKALAIGAQQRASQFPQVPTLQELGFGNTNLIAWFGMAVKSGTPTPLVNRLSEEVIKALRSPEVAQKFTSQGLDIAPLAAAPFRQYLDAETVHWGKVIRDAGIALE
ncbi:MAG: tripartite tricarboxylate transporter substrate binding protein [Cytophagales bacterium]|nr:tripartite tricarboxylate transporter substrate binding protein [Cytophagales bacterium]